MAGLAQLRIQSGERVDPERDPITLSVATSAVDYLHQVTDFNISVYKWLAENYSNVRVISAPELDAANASANVFYLYAETVADSGSDDNRVFVQNIQTQFMTLGVMQKTKGYEEAYSNATAGVMAKRPYAIYRASGI